MARKKTFYESFEVGYYTLVLAVIIAVIFSRPLIPYMAIGFIVGFIANRLNLI
ncbi:MAG: hypothetical protein ACTSQG_10635 [Promethearchaeota archaeon]